MVTHVFGTLVPVHPASNVISVPRPDTNTLYTMLNRFPVTGPVTK